MSELKSKHAFGSEENVDAALAQGLIDAYDILFLSEGKIGWIDKDGNKVIPENKSHVVLVDELPDVGSYDTIYIYNGKFYYWDGEHFISPSGGGVVTETTVDKKVDAAKSEAIESAKSYIDDQIASIEVMIEDRISEVDSAYEIIEF